MDPHDERTLSLHAQLVRTHDALRQRLHDVRDALDDPASGAPGPGLLEHCTAFCTALRTHHEGEDDGLFAALRRERPDLDATIGKLVADHEAIAGILRQIDALVRRAATADAAERTAVARELDGLAAIVTSHFGFEERALRDALDGVSDTGWTDTVFVDPLRA